jgi:hypothetical protein
MGRSRKERPNIRLQGETQADGKQRIPYKRLKKKTKDWLNFEEDDDDLELLLHMDD